MEWVRWDGAGWDGVLCDVMIQDSLGWNGTMIRWKFLKSAAKELLDSPETT